MKKTVSKLFALLLASSVVLSGCNSSTGETSGEKTDGESTTAQNEQTESEQDAQSSADEITDLVIPKVATRELETFNILHSQLASDFENLCNLTEPLLEVDTYGELSPALAEEGEQKMAV